MKLTTTTKRWGNSVGILLPRKLGFKPDQEVTILIGSARPVLAKDLWGLLKTGKSTAKVMRELKKELHGI